MIEILTAKILARQAAEHWQTEFAQNLKDDSQLQKLAALGPDPDPADIDRIMGYRLFTEIYCSVCGQDVPVACQFSNDPGYTNLVICEGCLQKGLSKFIEQDPLAFSDPQGINVVACLRAWAPLVMDALHYLNDSSHLDAGEIGSLLDLAEQIPEAFRPKYGPKVKP